MKDLHSGMSIINAIGPIAATADATSAAIDLQGFDSAEIIIALGIGGITFDATNKIEIKATHSDDNVTYTDVAASDILGETGAVTTGIIKSFIAAHAAAAVYRYGYVGGKRYIKVQDDRSGVHGTATPIAIMVARGNPDVGPVANT